VSSIISFDFDSDIDDLLDRLDKLPPPELPSPHYPVKDDRYKLVESRGDWELYEFKITRERNWCSVTLIKDQGIGFAFYDPEVDPMWQPPMPSDEDTFAF
jgi:hypothetical protein